MDNLLLLVAAYIIGGLTFIPILACLVLLHAYHTQPSCRPRENSGPTASLELSDAERRTATEHTRSAASDDGSRARDPDVAAGHFAVCREYIPGGVNGKLMERSTMSSQASVESPSVYQTMYRSIFERGRTQSPSLDAVSQSGKRAPNVFFIVIRLGLLMLYDDAEQLEVRHVISLENYDIDIFGEEDKIPEGELWIKRNCIRMSRRKANHDSSVLADFKPFFLFSNNCSEKEDFYHAMLLNQSRDRDGPTAPLHFENDDMIKLIRQLHASEDNLQTRWINALLGRVFLSMYKTGLVEHAIRTKINKKLSRVAKPAFISAIQIRDIYVGDCAPLITAPKLKELTRDGDLTLEADIKYKGSARIDVAAIATFDLGPRFKSRQVQILLAVICKSLEGHMYIRVKPPPSNRIWFSFVSMPKLDLLLEPVISSRQITYGVVLRAIEARIREVIVETLVYPNWDDIPFFNTESNPIRGGLWSDSSATAHRDNLSTAPKREEEELLEFVDDSNAQDTVTKTTSEIHLEDSGSILVGANRRKKATGTTLDMKNDCGTSSAIESSVMGTPRAMRANSFATVASPVVTRDPALIDASSEGVRSIMEAARGLKDISSRSQYGTPSDSPVGSPATGHDIPRRKKDRSMSSASKYSGSDGDPVMFEDDILPRSRSLASKDDQVASDGSSVYSKSAPRSNMLQKRPTITDTASAARKWGLGLMARHSPSSSLGGSHRKDESSQDNVLDAVSIQTQGINAQPQSALFAKAQPMGRGQPLPPPGQPLPGPLKANRLSWTGPLALFGRKRTGIDAKSTASSYPPAAGLAQEFADESASQGSRPFRKDDVECVGHSGETESNAASIADTPVLPQRPMKRPSIPNEDSGENLTLSGEHDQSLLQAQDVNADAHLDVGLSGSIGSEQASGHDLQRPTPALLEQDSRSGDIDKRYNRRTNSGSTEVIEFEHSDDRIGDTETNRRQSSVSIDIPSTPITSAILPNLPGSSRVTSAIPIATATIPRKPRSRQSLIPTPTNSRKTSPVGSTLSKTSTQGSEAQSSLPGQTGKRASVQSLHELVRRRSSQMYGSSSPASSSKEWGAAKGIQDE